MPWTISISGKIVKVELDHSVENVVIGITVKGY